MNLHKVELYIQVPNQLQKKISLNFTIIAIKKLNKYVYIITWTGHAYYIENALY